MLCFICKSSQTNANSLTKYLKVNHGLCSGKTLSLKCGQAGCAQVYGTLSGFRKHLNKAYEPCSDSGEGPFTAEDSVGSVCYDLPSIIPPPSNSILLQKSLVQSCAATIAELKVAGVGESMINSFHGRDS